MAITFKREYSRATVVKTEDGFQDVITSVYCALYATDENGLMESMGDIIDLNPPDPTQFIPFDQITIELLDSWVMPRSQYAYMESRLTDAINLRLTPTVIIKELPFNIEIVSDPLPIVDPLVIDDPLPIVDPLVIVDPLPIVDPSVIVDETIPIV